MKLSYQDRLDIYNKWKNEKRAIKSLSREYKINPRYISYMVRRVERHGVEALRIHRDKYSLKIKEEAINRYLFNHETLAEISLDLDLSSKSLVTSWVNSYIKNGYTVVKRKRRQYAKEEKDGRRIYCGNRSSIKEECRATEPKFDSYDTERIHKKIECLSYGKRKPRKQEIAQAITELRQETGRSLGFLLDVIQSNTSLPQISRSDYYYWFDKQDSDWKYDDLMNEIIRLYYVNKRTYGYRRITLYLQKKGINVNHKTVKRLMSKMGLYGKRPKAKYKSYKGDMNGTVKNLLLDIEVDEEKHTTRHKRNFQTDTVNQKWTTDVTEFKIPAGKLYLSPILDMYNGEIISYNISRHPNFKQVMNMLDIAFKKHKHLEGLVFHSDQGWQYQMAAYHKSLKDKGIIQSMSRKGNCLDNCVMENFFGKLKNEMFYECEFEFKSLDHLASEIEYYIDYYNNQRIQVRLKGSIFNESSFSRKVPLK